MSPDFGPLLMRRLSGQPVPCGLNHTAPEAARTFTAGARCLSAAVTRRTPSDEGARGLVQVPNRGGTYGLRRLTLPATGRDALPEHLERLANVAADIEALERRLPPRRVGGDYIRT